MSAETAVTPEQPAPTSKVGALYARIARLQAEVLGLRQIVRSREAEARHYAEQARVGRTFEREACAETAARHEGPHQTGDGTPCSCGEQIAAAIRARSSA